MRKFTLQPWHVGLAIPALIAALVALWPIGLGQDYMNHLARTYIQGHLHSEPALQAFYAISYDFVPDLTMDLIVPWLSQVTGIYNAGAVTIWLAFVLPFAAGLALAKTLHGRVTWGALLGSLAVFNANMAWGFVNYTASSGLALFAFVLWIRMNPGWRRTLAFLPIGLFVVINHALAFLMFGFLALAWEGVSFLKAERGSRVQFFRQSLLLDLPAMLGGLVFLGLSMLHASDLPRQTAPLYELDLKVETVFTVADFGNAVLAVAISWLLVGFFVLGFRQGWLMFAPKMSWVVLAFLVLVLVMPTTIFGIWGLHLRFAAPLLIVLAASVVPTEMLKPVQAKAIGALFGGLGFVAFANAAIQMASIDRQADTLRAQLAALPTGQKVLITFYDEESNTPFAAHAGALAVIERNAYVPNLFTNTSFVDVAPQMIDLHMPQSKPVYSDELLDWAARPTVASENGHWSLSFAADWPNQWDYLLFFKTAEQSALGDLSVCEISATPTVILYQTKPCA